MRSPCPKAYKTISVDLSMQHPITNINVYSILSRQHCQLFIQEAEKTAARLGGWTKTRHNEAPTTDIPFNQLGGHHKEPFQRWKKIFIRQVLRPIFRRDYYAHFQSFHDLFIVRYQAEEQRDLVTHRDGPPMSFVLQLNDDFQGGGTTINSLSRSLVHNVGDLCVHSGWLLHGAAAVTRGTRYVLIGFCEIKANWLSANRIPPGKDFIPDYRALRHAVSPSFRYGLRHLR
ncbi:MAG: hypothetical protein VX278_06260 [Myxococcota bacterium]|nr:hypothetical protein [Myxococcota bacterium]